MIGACTKCGCALEQCECPERAEGVGEVDSDFRQKLSMYLSFLNDYPDLQAVPCFDCLGDQQPYLVSNEVWEKAWPEHSAHREIMLEASESSTVDVRKACSQCLCLNCLQLRLGRPLVLKDFPPAPVNAGIRFGHGMGVRAGG